MARRLAPVQTQLPESSGIQPSPGMSTTFSATSATPAASDSQKYYWSESTAFRCFFASTTPLPMSRPSSTHLNTQFVHHVRLLRKRREAQPPRHSGLGESSAPRSQLKLHIRNNQPPARQADVLWPIVSAALVSPRSTDHRTWRRTREPDAAVWRHRHQPDTGPTAAAIPLPNPCGRAFRSLAGEAIGLPAPMALRSRAAGCPELANDTPDQYVDTASCLRMIPPGCLPAPQPARNVDRERLGRFGASPGVWKRPTLTCCAGSTMAKNPHG